MMKTIKSFFQSKKCTCEWEDLILVDEIPVQVNKVEGSNLVVLQRVFLCIKCGKGVIR